MSQNYNIELLHQTKIINIVSHSILTTHFMCLSLLLPVPCSLVTFLFLFLYMNALHRSSVHHQMLLDLLLCLSFPSTQQSVITGCVNRPKSI